MSLRRYNKGNAKRIKYSNGSLPNVSSIRTKQDSKSKKNKDSTLLKNSPSFENSLAGEKSNTNSIGSERIIEETEEDDNNNLSDGQEKFMEQNKSPKDIFFPLLKILRLSTHKKQRDHHTRSRRKSKKRDFGGISIISEGSEKIKASYNYDDTVMNPNLPSVRNLKQEESLIQSNRVPSIHQVHWKHIDYDDFYILELLGHGALSKVYKAWHKPSKQFVALKYLELADGRENEIMADAKNEVKILERLNLRGHQNIVKYFDIFTENRSGSEVGNTKRFLIIMMEYGRSSMADILKVRKKYSEREILFIMRDICDALVEAEKMGIANRDIKPQNLILSYDMKQYKVADFGVGCLVSDKRDLFKLDWAVGTSIFLSPEVHSIYQQNLKGRAKTIIYNPFKSDMYSFGITVMRMMGLRQTLFQKRRKNFDIDKSSLDSMKDEYPIVVGLLRQMLKKNYLRRTGFEDLLQKLNDQVMNELDEREYVSNLPDKFKFDEYFEKHKYYLDLADIYGNISDEVLLDVTESLELPPVVLKSFNNIIQKNHPDHHIAEECLQNEIKYLKKGINDLISENSSYNKSLLDVYYKSGLTCFKLKDFPGARDMFSKALDIWNGTQTCGLNREAGFMINHALSQVMLISGEIEESAKKAEIATNILKQKENKQYEIQDEEELRLHIMSNDLLAKTLFLASLKTMKSEGRGVELSKKVNITKFLFFKKEEEPKLMPINKIRINGETRVNETSSDNPINESLRKPILNFPLCLKLFWIGNVLRQKKCLKCEELGGFKLCKLSKFLSSARRLPLYYFSFFVLFIFFKIIKA